MMNEAKVLCGIVVVGKIRDTVRKVKISIITIIASACGLLIVIARDFVFSAGATDSNSSPWSRRIIISFATRPSSDTIWTTCSRFLRRIIIIVSVATPAGSNTSHFSIIVKVIVIKEGWERIYWFGNRNIG
jgi:hypothetical protein